MNELMKKIANHLGLEPIPIKYEDITDDSRMYFEKGYIAISCKLKDNYEECAKCIAHEMRHLFQIWYAKLMNDERAIRWKEEFQHGINSSNMTRVEEYLSQELELDAFAFTKYYLETYEGIEVVHKVPMYEKLIEAYIRKNREIM